MTKIKLWVAVSAISAASAGAPCYQTAAADVTLSQAVQAQLRMTRSDYKAMSSEAIAAAISAASALGISASDALSAAVTIAAQPNFQGNDQQLETLIRLAVSLARPLNETVPGGAREIALAMRDPGEAAERLERCGILGITAMVVDDIKMQADSGDPAGAFDKLFTILYHDATQ